LASGIGFRVLLYAFLPFFYDEKAAALREANQRFLAEGELPALQKPMS
jgi:hypothetical protein